MPPLDTGPSNPRWQNLGTDDAPNWIFRWDEVAGASRYDIQWATEVAGGGAVSDATSAFVFGFPKKFYTVDGIFPSQSARVRAADGAWSAWVNRPGPPVTITSVTVGTVDTVPEAGTVQFTVAVAGNFDSYTTVWSVVSGLGSIDSDGVYSTGDIGPQTSNVAATVRATVTAIGDGTNADVGHSATATDDEAFVVAPYPAPTLVAASGDGRVDLSWAIPSAWSAFSLRWDVQRKLTSASSWTQVAQVTSPSYRASGLNNGTSYDFRVRATDPAGAPVTPDSPWSGTVSATPAGRPVTITSVTVGTVDTVPEAGTVQFTVAVAGNFDSYTTVWSVVSYGRIWCTDELSRAACLC